MRVSLARCVRFLALRRRRRLSSWALVLCLAFVYGSLLFSGRAHAGSLSEEYRVWSKISFDGLYWKTDISQLLLAEGFQVGGSGYIYDPYIVGFRAEAGLIEYNMYRLGSWDTSIGWRALAMLNFVPASKFPLDLHFQRSSLGLRPGADPAYNMTNATDFGGRWSLLFAGWPHVFLSSTYTITDYNVGSGLIAPTSNQALTGYTETRLRADARVTRNTKRHSYDMRLEFYDDRENRSDRGLRRGRFWASDRAMLGDRFQVQGTVTGDIGEIGDQDYSRTTKFSDYRASLYVLYSRPQVLRLNTRANFYQSFFDESEQLGGDVISEAFWTPRKWLEAFAGLAFTYLDEAFEGEFQREMREQLGLGARVFLALPYVGGRFEGKLLGRFGDGQAFGLGRGLFTAVDVFAHWIRPVGRSVDAFVWGHLLHTRDRSPLGADFAIYEGRVGVARAGTSHFGAQGYGYINHREQEEIVRGSYTDTYTEVGANLVGSFRPIPWIHGIASASYSHYLESEMGTQSVIVALARVMAMPTETLRVQGSLTYSGRFQGSGRYSTMRAEGEVSWVLRQLTVDASYIFLLDDYRGLSGGDHRVMLRLVRTFDVRFGRKTR